MMFDKLKNEKINLFLITISIFIASMPAFGIFKMYNAVDISFHIRRVEGFIEAVKNISLPYRINSVANLGYTGADATMYPHMPLYILSFLHMLFNDYNIVFNIYAIIINIITALIMYYSALKIFEKKNVALISTLMVVLSCTRINLVYVGGAIGEYTAVMFIPLVACGYIDILRSKKVGFWELLIALTLIAQTHILTIFYLSLLLICISLIFIKRIIKNRVILFTLLKVALFCILLNIWFYIPFIDYFLNGKILSPGAEVRTDIALSNIMTLKDHFLTFFGRIRNLFLFTTMEVHCRHLTYMSIFALLFIIIYILINYFIKKRAVDENQKICNVFVLIFILAFIIYAGIFTRCFFANIEFLRNIFSLQQFEVRGVIRALPLLYMSFAYMFNDVLKDKWLKLLIIFVVALVPIVMFYNFLFAHLEKIDDFKDFANGDYMLMGTLKGNTTKLILNDYNLTLPKNIFDGSVKISDENIEISNEEKGYLSYSLNYENLDGGEHIIIFPYFNYKGFSVYNSKGKKIKIKNADNNLVSVVVRDSSGKLKVKFEEPIHWIISTIISLLSYLFFIGCLVYYVKHYKKTI